jgi:hypothetical protein
LRSICRLKSGLTGTQVSPLSSLRNSMFAAK